jgi:hypothetical protein
MFRYITNRLLLCQSRFPERLDHPAASSELNATGQTMAYTLVPWALYRSLSIQMQSTRGSFGTLFRKVVRANASIRKTEEVKSFSIPGLSLRLAFETREVKALTVAQCEYILT